MRKIPKIIYCCIDCAFPISEHSGLYGGGRCPKCNYKYLIKIGKIGRKGKDNPCWKEKARISGGKHAGYVGIHAPDHPNKTKKGFMSEHRLVMEKKLGRKLLSSEHTHHKNENRKDNKPENLEIVSYSQHCKKHRKIEWIQLICVECKKKFRKMAKDERRRIKKNMKGPFCGSSCKGKWCRKEQIKRKINVGRRAGMADRLG